MDLKTLTYDQWLTLTSDEYSALLADVSSPPALQLTWFALSSDEWALLSADQLSNLPADLPPPLQWKPLIAPFSYSPLFSVFATGTNGALNPKRQRTGHFINVPKYRGPITVSLGSSFINSEIRYTVDGSQPKASSFLYTEPLVFSTNATSEDLTQLRATIFNILDLRRYGGSVLLEFNVI